jgi:hypothetical protein
MLVGEAKSHLVLVGSPERPGEIQIAILLNHAPQSYDARSLVSEPSEAACRFLGGIAELDRLGNKYGLETYTAEWLQGGMAIAVRTTGASIVRVEPYAQVAFPAPNDRAGLARLHEILFLPVDLHSGAAHEFS